VDADLSLEVTAPSLGGGRSEKIQEEGSDMENVWHTAAVSEKMIRRARRCIASRGLMEFAGVDKTARSKMGVWKMQEWTYRHGMARVDNAGEIIQ